MRAYKCDVCGLLCAGDSKYQRFVTLKTASGDEIRLGIKYQSTGQYNLTDLCPECFNIALGKAVER